MFCIKKDDGISDKLRKFLEKNNCTKDDFLKIVSNRMDLLYNYVSEDVYNNINIKMLNNAHVIKLTSKSARCLVELNNLHVILYQEGYRHSISPSISSMTTITTTTTRKKIIESKTTSNTTVFKFPNLKGHLFCTNITTKTYFKPTPKELKINGTYKSITTSSSWSAPPFQIKKVYINKNRMAR
ncbi:hypothetical protein ACTA71_009374 [Dictyostelium dimigraforme]